MDYRYFKTLKGLHYFGTLQITLFRHKIFEKLKYLECLIIKIAIISTRIYFAVFLSAVPPISLTLTRLRILSKYG